MLFKNTYRWAILLALTAFLFCLGCDKVGKEPPTAVNTMEAKLSKSNGGGKGDKGGGSTVQLSMSGDLFADTQTIKGRNDQRTISVKGDYTLTMALDLSALECGDLPGSIPDEAGLVAFVQEHTPRNGTLSLNYDKTEPHAGNVDYWETVIGKYKYRVQFFRWQSQNFTQQSDGTTVVNYRDGSVEVFKMKGGRFISREQCFGAFVNYDLTVK